MATEIPDEVRQLARVAAAEGARRAADLLLGNEGAMAYSVLEVDGVSVGAVLVVFDSHTSARLIEFAVSLGAEPTPVVESSLHTAPGARLEPMG